MALSGSLKTGNFQGRYVQFSWSATQNIEKNQSTISWTLKGAGEAQSGYYLSAPFLVTIAGEEVYKSSTRIQLWNGTLVASGTKTLTHDSTGAKSFKVEVKAAIYAASYNCTGSDTFTLDNIARAATITSASNFSDEEKPKISFSNPLGDKATVAVGVYWDSETALIPYATVTGTSGTKEFTLTDEQKTAIYNKLKTSNSESVYYYVRTTIDGTHYYNKLKKTVSIVNANPTFEISIEEADARVLAATGNKLRWVSNYSDIKFAFTNAAAHKGATISNYLVVCGSKKSTAASGSLYNIDNNEVHFVLTDSRGNSKTIVYNGVLINYTELSCSMTASIALDSADTTQTKAKATLSISGKAFSGQIKEGTANSVRLWYRYKKDNENYGDWVAIEGTQSISSGKYSTTYDVTELDYQSAYTFQVRAADDIYVAYGTYKNSKEIPLQTKPIFDWSNEDFNFNVPVIMQGLNLQKIINAFTASTQLTVTTSAGTGYSDISCEAYLIGNIIRFSFGATRSPAYGGGNLSPNEKVMTVTVEHSGKVQSSFNTSFSTGATGAVSTLYTTNLAKTTGADGKETGTGFSFDIYLAATGTASGSFGGFFMMPVTLNFQNF